MIWLDGLDLPMAAEMEGIFFEPFAEDAHRVEQPARDSERRYGIGQLRPAWEEWTRSHSPLLNYKWAHTEVALQRLEAVGASPFDDVAMEYINPRPGGPVLPTIACRIQLLQPGVRTQAHRHTGSAVYLAFEGRRCRVIDASDSTGARATSSWCLRGRGTSTRAPTGAAACRRRRACERWGCVAARRYLAIPCDSATRLGREPAAPSPAGQRRRLSSPRPLAGNLGLCPLARTTRASPAGP